MGMSFPVSLSRLSFFCWQEALVITGGVPHSFCTEANQVLRWTSDAQLRAPIVFAYASSSDILHAPEQVMDTYAVQPHVELNA
jgi:hypothetical protein